MKNSISISRLLLTVLFITSILLTACTSASEELGVGDKAPQFSLTSSTGSEVALTDYLGEKSVLLFFHMAKG